MDGVPPTRTTRKIINIGAARSRSLLWAAVCLLLALLPAANIIRILAANGVDTPSNDYLMFLQQADRFLTGQNDWRQYFRDTMYMRLHSYAFLFPVRLLLLRLSHMSVYAEIAAGMLLAGARLLLLYRLLTVMLPAPPSRRWFERPYLWLLPGLSALVFASAQVSTFSYGETILQFGFIQVFGMVALLVLLNQPLTAPRMWLSVACGLLASYSGGGGLSVWPVLLLVIAWRHTRRLAAYAAWLAGLAAAAWPYLAYAAGDIGGLQTPRLTALFTGLGLPFANQINYGVRVHSQAAESGALGMLLAAVALALLWVFRRQIDLKKAVPPLLVLAWGLVYAVQVMLTRPMIAPWYTTGYSLFWAGLLGLVAVIQSIVMPRPWERWRTGLLAGWGLAAAATLVLLYVRTNLTVTDKSFYMASRSPAAAACLRNYLSAPTYCEGVLFQWSLGAPDNVALMGQPLARHSLSVLGSEQVWTLQGELVMGTVHGSPDSSAVYHSWVRGARDLSAHWTSAAHLNALIDGGQSLHWQLDLPEGLRSAVFHTAVSPSAASACSAGGPEGVFTIDLEDARGSRHALLPAVDICPDRDWQPVEVDLSAYAGQRVTLVLSASGNGSSFAARLRYPYIRLAGVPRSPAWDASPQPANVSDARAPAGGSLAYRMPLRGDGGWQLENLQPLNDTGRFAKTDPTAIARIDGETEICLRDWSQFFLHAAMPDSQERKLVLVRFTFDPGQGQPEAQALMPLPLLASEELRQYTLNLNMLDAPPGACITAVEVILSYFPPPDGANWIELPEAGFLPR